jgi:hypothetical protein
MKARFLGSVKSNGIEPLGECHLGPKKVEYKSVLRIHDILGWIRIRIRGSMPLTNGSGSGSWIRILLFSLLTFKMPAKN